MAMAIREVCKFECNACYEGELCEFAEFPEERKSYVVRSDDSAYKVAIFNRADVESYYGEIVPGITSDEYLEEIASGLTGWGRSYNGPGRWFSSDPSIRVLKRNIVVRQFCAQDI